MFDDIILKGCKLPAGPWDESCTLEANCLCGCEGGDPDDDSWDAGQNNLSGDI